MSRSSPSPLETGTSDPQSSLSESPVFHQWGKLPAELQWMVWNFAMQRPRLVDLEIYRKGHGPGYSPCVVIHNQQPHSPLLHVNGQSRLIAREFYTVQLPCHYFKRPYGQEGIMFLNLEHDIICINSERRRILPEYEQELLHSIDRLEVLLMSITDVKSQARNGASFDTDCEVLRLRSQIRDFGCRLQHLGSLKKICNCGAFDSTLLNELWGWHESGLYKIYSSELQSQIADLGANTIAFADDHLAHVDTSKGSGVTVSYSKLALLRQGLTGVERSWGSLVSWKDKTSAIEIRRSIGFGMAAFQFMLEMQQRDPKGVGLRNIAFKSPEPCFEDILPRDFRNLPPNCRPWRNQIARIVRQLKSVYLIGEIREPNPRNNCWKEVSDMLQSVPRMSKHTASSGFPYLSFDSPTTNPLTTALSPDYPRSEYLADSWNLSHTKWLKSWFGVRLPGVPPQHASYSTCMSKPVCYVMLYCPFWSKYRSVAEPFNKEVYILAHDYCTARNGGCSAKSTRDSRIPPVTVGFWVFKTDVLFRGGLVRRGAGRGAQLEFKLREMCKMAPKLMMAN